MKILFAAFVLALVCTAGTSIGFAVWDGRFHHDNVRAVHYDSNYDMSATRRLTPVDPRN